MQIFQLIPNGDKWELKSGEGAVIATYENEKAAVEGSRRAVEHEGGSLIIQRTDGTLDECSYLRVNDPVESPG
ncbi:MAG TPA: DUF2188 domain-containing protein [Verrucomicrobiales bacterium]|jgi:hypothetical protein|nr:DUF2188 domain-containing protein [Verrucomicrobiales bacterium]